MGMPLGAALVQQLLATAGVTGEISTRIYPSVAPENALLPRVTYQQISMVPVHAMSADAILKETRWQVSSFAGTYSGVRTVAKEIETALKDYKTSVSGLFGDGTSGVDVQRIFFESDIDFKDIDTETKEITYHVAQDFIIWAST